MPGRKPPTRPGPARRWPFSATLVRVEFCTDPLCLCDQLAPGARARRAAPRPSPALFSAEPDTRPSWLPARLPASLVAAGRLTQKQEPETPARDSGSTDVDWSGVERGRSLDSAR
jgi:hypothetical protein